MHLGLDSRMHSDPQEYAARLAANLAPFIATLKHGGCALALENVFEATPAPLLAARQAMLDAGSGHVGFCLDVGHAATFSATPLQCWLETQA